MVASSRSSRSRAGGKSIPYAACSRSHQPAPRPQKARPPLSTSRVAAVLAITPAGRRVTGETRVPSRSDVSRPASRPRVTQGSGIGSQARSTWGIWIRWSITAMPANPTWSAVTAISRSQPAGSLPHRKRDSCRMTGTRPSSGVGDEPAAATGGGVGGPVGRSVSTMTRSQPSVRGERGERTDLAELGGEDVGRYGAVALGVPGPAQPGGRVQDDEHRRQPGGCGPGRGSSDDGPDPVRGCRPPSSGRGAAGRR